MLAAIRRQLSKMTLTINLEGYNDNIGNSMREAFGEKHSELDPFNTKSEYLTIYSNDDIAALGRLTNCPDGVFYTWTKGSKNFSNTTDTLDLGRCLVTKPFRGGNFYDLLITYCFFHAFSNGYKYVNGSTVVNRKMVDRLTLYGFTKSGDTVLATEPDGKEYELQAYVADLDKTKSIWEKILAEQIVRYQMDGYQLKYKNCNEVHLTAY